MAGTGLVLVVDDDPAIQDTVRAALELDGYRVVAAADGAAALGLLDDLEPCVILLDMRMPVLDGWGFAAAYRGRGAAHAPLVVMTAAENAQRWCREIGAEACLAKPFDLDELYGAVERFCRDAA
ncbi:MAG TPA: response regulator [Chloroflexota bacterium]|nr:response regulator [Chloroflexota bacterium]